jgi:hypothetical protein
MRKRTRLAIAAAAALAVSMTVAPAAASPVVAANTVLTYGSPGGTAVAVGDVLVSDLKPGTLATFYSTTSGSTGVKCTESSFSATVTSNPPVDGVATETLTAHAFDGCDSNVVGVLGVQSVTVDNLPYSASVDSVTENVTLTGAGGPIQSTVRLLTLFGSITCVYRDADGVMTGTTSDIDNSITFTNERFDKVSGPGLCFSTAYFSATYAPVTGPGGLVFVN